MSIHFHKMSSEYFSRNIPLESSSSRSPPVVASALTNLPQASVATFQESFIPFQELTAISAEFFGSPQYRFGAWRTTGRKHLRDFDDDGLNASGLEVSGLETSLDWEHLDWRHLDWRGLD